MCWCVALSLILAWLSWLPSFGGHRPIANFAVLVATLLLLLPWSVACVKSAWRLTDRWPQPSRAGVFHAVFRAISIAAPIGVFCAGLLVAAFRLGVAPDVGDSDRPLAVIGWEGVPEVVVLVLGLLVIAGFGLWARAGRLIGRAAVGRSGSVAARLRVGIGLLAGAVGVILLVALDLAIRQRMGVVDFIATGVLLLAGVIAVLFAWTFGALHARLCVLVGAIESAEDDVRRRERNRLGVLAGDRSMNESSATPPRGPDRSQDEIGPIGGHPDPPGL